jgi:putative ABC transport system permease protein
MVTGDGARMAAIGGVVGVIGALAAARVLAPFLFGVSARDPVTLLAVPLLLVGCACVAALLPARRAVSVNPLTALRYE